VGEDIEKMAFNTAVSALMIFVNECTAAEKIPVETWKKFLKLLAPFAPHMAEELWRVGLSQKKTIHLEAWPEFHEVKEENFTLVIQVNGKVRDSIEVPSGISEEEAKQAALRSERVKSFLQGNEPKRVIYVPGRLVNVVV
jgi:leucyl-tRNA synthetase